MLALLGSAKSVAIEPTLKYDLSGSSMWVPYFMEDPRKPGILGELVPQILVKAGVKGQQVMLPAARMVVALEKGDIDFDIISPSWFSHREFTSKYVLSEPLVPIAEYIVQLAATTSKITKMEDIAGRRIGTVRGYYYHNDNDFDRVDFSSEKQLIQALKSNRISYAIIGDLPAKYWSNQLGVAINLSVLHSQGYLHIRLRNEHAPLLNQLNKAIFSLKEAKIVNDVTQKYVNALQTD